MAGWCNGNMQGWYTCAVGSIPALAPILWMFLCFMLILFLSFLALGVVKVFVFFCKIRGRQPIHLMTTLYKCDFLGGFICADCLRKLSFIYPNFVCEVVSCFMSKGRSLKSCVALVVFCCSLLLVCISPVFADTTSGDPNSFALYSSFSGQTQATLGSKPLVIPASGSHVFCSAGNLKDYQFKIRPYVDVPEMVPVDFDRTLLLNLGIQGAGLVDISMEALYTYSHVYWYQSSYVEQTRENSCWRSYQSMLTPNGLTQFYKAIIPAHATAIHFFVPDNFVYIGQGDSFGSNALVSFGGYVVDTDNQDIVDVVNDILTEVHSINSNTSDLLSISQSSLSALNLILDQCKSLNADTDTIITILNAVKSQLVTLNGKVDNIYTLLKDSLKTESAAVDKQAQETADQIMQRVDAEQYWSDKNTETFEALDMGNWSFGTGVVGTLPTVSNLFKGLWDSFGEAVLIFTFPLMLGLALVVIGRLSRHSGKGGKDGGDSA